MLNEYIKSKEEIRKESREKFGQFYLSIGENNKPRTIDFEGGIEVTAEDNGEKLRVFASTTQENWWLSKIDELLKSQRDSRDKELREWAERNKKEDPSKYPECTWNSALDEILSLLKEDIKN